MISLLSTVKIERTLGMVLSLYHPLDESLATQKVTKSVVLYQTIFLATQLAIVAYNCLIARGVVCSSKALLKVAQNSFQQLDLDGSL